MFSAGTVKLTLSRRWFPIIIRYSVTGVGTACKSFEVLFTGLLVGAHACVPPKVSGRMHNHSSKRVGGKRANVTSDAQGGGSTERQQHMLYMRPHVILAHMYLGT
jgi:hypothetical protein